ncbi:WD40 repeat domain-containing protein [Microcoleus sp. FACHB-672]|uniref:WD40 repeat domain-containing protein n=1 Tax=Microcoleus sp. FACHB-672 TaxID=2692825 RepID=UPI001683110D|nr:hypothetical protein [Microcoleus sp. FACHB-672]MBD2041468.1 hypothetical protein [Microcoleus sp. FACHB-672]
MKVEEALAILDQVLWPQRLNKVQEIVLRHAWKGLTYQQMAKTSDYDADYIRDTGSKLWQLLSQTLGEKVTKNNVQSVLRGRTTQRKPVLETVLESISGSESIRDHSHTRIASVALCPQSQKIACGSGDGTIKLWDVNTDCCLNTFQGHTDVVSSIAFSSDGKTLVSGSFDETIKLWDVNIGNCLKTLRIAQPYEAMQITDLRDLNEPVI